MHAKGAVNLAGHHAMLFALTKKKEKVFEHPPDRILQMFHTNDQHPQTLLKCLFFSLKNSREQMQYP